MRLNPFVAVAIGLATVAWAVFISTHGATPRDLYWFSFLGPALAFVLAGLVAWNRRPENRIGRLMVLTGFLIGVVTMTGTRNPILFTIGWWLGNFSAAAIVYVVLAFPRGSLTTRVERVVYWSTFAVVLGLMPQKVFFDPARIGCGDCPPGLNLLLLRNSPEAIDTGDDILGIGVIAVLLAWVILLVTRLVRSSPPSRWLIGPVVIPAVVWGFMHVYGVAGRYVEEGLPVVGIDLSAVALMLIPVVFLLGLFRVRARHVRVADLVRELGGEDIQTQAPGASRSRPPVALFVVVGLAAVSLGPIVSAFIHIPINVIVEWYAYAGAGIAAWAMWPENRIGKLLVAYTFLVWPITFVFSGEPVSPILWTIAPIVFMVSAHGIHVYTMLTFPRGRLKGWLESGIFFLLVGNIVWQVVMQLFIDPRDLGCAACPEGLNLILIRSEPELIAFMARFNPWWLTAVMLPTAVLLVVRFARATRPSRRVLAPMVIPAVAWLVAHRVAGMAQVLAEDPTELLEAPPPLLVTLGGIEQAATIALPFSFLLGLWRIRARRARVAGLVTDIQDVPTIESVEAAVQRALSDPTARVGYHVPGTGEFVAADGTPLELPTEGSGRLVTFLEREGTRLAAIVHDEALRYEPDLLEAVRSAARLALENERLQAEVREQLEEVRASRSRLVAAGDAERKRVERNLHDGAQQRLLTLSLQLRMVADAVPGGDPELRTMVDRAAGEADSALEELRELAQGVHPSILTDEGLGPAIEYLAERSPVPVDIEVAPGRFDEQVEATAYFVVAEALANVAKYAHASGASVRVHRDSGSVRVEVSDDGVGGADPIRGSGLRGLHDRVAAAGGRLEIKSAPGSGTHLVAEIPSTEARRGIP